MKTKIGWMTYTELGALAKIFILMLFLRTCSTHKLQVISKYP